MQQDQVEVTFCDLCGASVPVADLASGAAVRHQGKLIGGCCLAGLRAAVGVAEVGPRSGADGKLMPVAIVLLAATAAATIFLDQRISGVETKWRSQHEELVLRQRSDSEVLQALSVDMDATVRRADVDGLVEKVGTLDGAVRQGDEQARAQIEQVRADVAAMHKDVRAASAGAVDYRPLIEDLRQQMQRQAAALADLRNAPPPVPVAPAEVPPPQPAEGGGDEVPALPGPLAEHARKLQSTDPAVRFEAVDELLRSKNAAVLVHLLPLARDPDAFVRRLTIEGLRDFKRPEAVEALLTGLADNDENVRDTAWRSLREVTGQKIPFEATASKDARARAVQRWQEWWDKNKATFGG